MLVYLGLEIALGGKITNRRVSNLVNPNPQYHTQT